MRSGIPFRSARSWLAMAMLAAAAATLVGGCAPAVVAVGAGVAALVVTDRRSTGAQADDQTIELKVLADASTKWGADVHLNVTSFNGNVLLSGEAPTPEVRNEILQMAKRTDRVRNVYDEIVVGPNTDLGARTNDTYLTSAVKTRFVEVQTFSPTHVKVVTERRVVYLMGIVTREEGSAAAKVAATTSGVARVVKLFEYTN